MSTSDSKLGGVLLAVDGSDHALAAAHLLKNLPLPPDCKIDVISVLIPRLAQYYEGLQAFMTQAWEMLTTAGREVTMQLLSGDPAEQIIEYASTRKPDLIVLGAKGRRATMNILLGGVAQQVVEYASCPILVVRSPHERVKRVLIVTDGSPHSELAIRHLGRCPLPADAELSLLHVLPPPVTPETIMRAWPVGMDVIPPIPSPEIEASLLSQAEAEEGEGQVILDKSLEIIRSLGLEATAELRRGDAATEILAFAEEKKIDLIITGSRGLSRFQGWLLGSVSRKLVHYAPCSVLIVKS